MNRFLALPGLAATIRGLLCCIGGALGCTAMAGAISIGAAASADAAAFVDPEARKSLPPVCRHAMNTGDRRAMHRCRRAWHAMHERSWRERSRRRYEDDGAAHRRGDRTDRTHRYRRHPTTPRWLEELFHHWPTAQATPSSPTPRPALPKTGRPKPSPSSPKPTRTHSPKPSEQPTLTPTPEPTTTLTDDLDARPPSLQPVLLLGLLLPALAAICYPFRHRLAAAAGVPRLPVSPATEPPQPQLGHRPGLDPFAAQVLGLTGPGAPAAARILTVTALDEHGDDSLVVIPRPDTTILFGLAEDELLDDDTAALFIPGNLDAALAYLETELAIRENRGVTQARRLLLVADPEEELKRIQALLDRHPRSVSMILLGAWPGDSVTVDQDGLVDASSSVAARLPDRLPALSRTEARDRLFSTLARHKKEQKPPPKRRSTSRRPKAAPDKPPTTR